MAEEILAIGPQGSGIHRYECGVTQGILQGVRPGQVLRCTCQPSTWVKIWETPVMFVANERHPERVLETRGIMGHYVPCPATAPHTTCVLCHGTETVEGL